MTSQQSTNEHRLYNKQNFSIFIRNYENWDIYANENGDLAAIPTDEAAAYGCKPSHFGDMNYLRKLDEYYATVA